jgi:hypothetical protein
LQTVDALSEKLLRIICRFPPVSGTPRPLTTDAPPCGLWHVTQTSFPEPAGGAPVRFSERGRLSGDRNLPDGTGAMLLGWVWLPACAPPPNRSHVCRTTPSSFVCPLVVFPWHRTAQNASIRPERESTVAYTVSAGCGYSGFDALSFPTSFRLIDPWNVGALLSRAFGLVPAGAEEWWQSRQE